MLNLGELNCQPSWMRRWNVEIERKKPSFEQLANVYTKNDVKFV